ncbi:ATP synthase subunit I [Spirulina sp. CS-785/01]|uniref:ATP synthase subunit I n=1 Tax=Spirulina sp. CS-785/01 TaxID=3021716 RepID=UPI003FA6BB7B
MNSSDSSHTTESVSLESSPPETKDPNLEVSQAEDSNLENSNLDDSNLEYYQLQRTLYLVTLGLTVVIFTSVWVFYTLNTALNYLVGSFVGLVYLRLLAKDVGRLGNTKRTVVGFNRLAPLIGLIVFATQLQQLQILPVFLGFMTYKAAIIVYVLKTSIVPAQK